MTDPLQFLSAVILLLATPGPTNTVMATAGAGPRQSPLPLLLAELAGYTAIIAIASLVLVPLIAVWPPAGIILKLLVALYLVAAAVRLWTTPLAIDAATKLVGPRLVFLTTLFNPKGLVFAVAILPRDLSLIWPHAAFAALVFACGFAWFTLGRGIAALSGRNASILPRVASVALVGFAVLLVGTAAR